MPVSQILSDYTPEYCPCMACATMRSPEARKEMTRDGRDWIFTDEFGCVWRLTPSGRVFSPFDMSLVSRPGESALESTP